MCLTSPGYPSNYPDDQDTTQIFSLANADAIEITFEHFKVEDGPGYCPDYVEFFDGNGDAIEFEVEYDYGHPVVGTKLCGSSLPDTFTIETSTASVHFYSDSDWMGNNPMKGFKFCYAPGTIS